MNTREGNIVSATEQIFLRPEKIVSLWAGLYLATSTASAEEGDLLVGNLGTILLRKIGGLQNVPRSNRGQFLKLELVDASGGEGEEEECSERREEHGGAREQLRHKVQTSL